MNSSLAMSRLFMPLATSLRTCISRSVSLGAGTCWARSSSSRFARVANSVRSLPAVDSPDDIGDLIQRDVLEQVATGTRSDRLEEVLLLVADRQYDDLGAGCRLLHRTAGLDPAALRHPNVHEDDIRQRLGGLLDRLRPITRLTDQFDVVLSSENHLQATPEQRVIINDEGANRIRTPPGAH